MRTRGSKLERRRIWSPIKRALPYSTHRACTRPLRRSSARVLELDEISRQCLVLLINDVFCIGEETARSVDAVVVAQRKHASKPAALEVRRGIDVLRMSLSL